MLEKLEREAVMNKVIYFIVRMLSVLLLLAAAVILFLKFRYHLLSYESAGVLGGLGAMFSAAGAIMKHRSQS